MCLQVASEYFKDTTLLLMGVICLAASIEKWNLHKRIALRMVMVAGAKPGMYVFSRCNTHTRTHTHTHTHSPVDRLCELHVFFLCCRLVLGFMCCTVFLSMWLSNTSTTAMVMPIAEAVLQQLICTGIADSVGDSLTIDTQEEESGEAEHPSHYAVCTLLAVFLNCFVL